MRPTVVIFLIVVGILGLFVVRRYDRLKIPLLKQTPITSSNLNPTGQLVETGSNPFGVMFANSDKVKLGKNLGAAYYRTTVFIEKWNGSCPECDAAIKNGLKLVLTVRNNGGAGQPTTPPQNLVDYKKTLGQILDKYKPEVIAVENEENSASLFYTGSVGQYQEELKTACITAHERGIKCTNGGLVSSLTAGLVAASYYELGETAKANEYLQRTLGPKLEAEFGQSRADIQKLVSNPKVATQLGRGKQLLAGYKTSGADYVNFHWYVADGQALEEALNYLQAATGLRAITNEVGQQQNENPSQVTLVMQKITDLKLSYAIWFSVDISGFGGARSLIDSSGNLRPNGVAYQTFIKEHF